MSHPQVNIVNSTNYNVDGMVGYAACSTDEFSMGPNDPWISPDRGLCLLNAIYATVETPKGKIGATPYTSTGTSYSKFAMIQTGYTSFEVTRRVSASEDNRPADYVEPTEKQKIG